LHAYEYHQPISCVTQLTQIGREYPGECLYSHVGLQVSIRVVVMICATQWRVASLGLVTPGAVTDGVTLLFVEKLTTVLVIVLKR